MNRTKNELRQIADQANEILTRKRLKRLICLENRIYLKSSSEHLVPHGYEMITGTLIRVGTESAIVKINGRTLAVPVVLVRPVRGEQ